MAVNAASAAAEAQTLQRGSGRVFSACARREFAFAPPDRLFTRRGPPWGGLVTVLERETCGSVFIGIVNTRTRRNCCLGKRDLKGPLVTVAVVRDRWKNVRRRSQGSAVRSYAGIQLRKLHAIRPEQFKRDIGAADRSRDSCGSNVSAKLLRRQCIQSAGDGGVAGAGVGPLLKRARDIHGTVRRGLEGAVEIAADGRNHSRRPSSGVR